MSNCRRVWLSFFVSTFRKIGLNLQEKSKKSHSRTYACGVQVNWTGHNLIKWSFDMALFKFLLWVKATWCNMFCKVIVVPSACCVIVHYKETDQPLGIKMSGNVLYICINIELIIGILWEHYYRLFTVMAALMVLYGFPIYTCELKAG